MGLSLVVRVPESLLFVPSGLQIPTIPLFICLPICLLVLMRPFMYVVWLISLSLLSISCRNLDPVALPTSTLPPAFPGTSWEQVADVKMLGWDDEALEQVRKKAQDAGTHSLMVIDSGRLIAAFGDISEKFYIASCRKSLLSTLYGKYVADSTISLDATLETLGIDDKEGLTQTEKQATVRQLLLSSSNIYHPAEAQSNDDLPARGSAAPGSQFYYNNFDFNVLGTIFRNETGQDIFEEFDTQIASQIGMEDFHWESDGRYEFTNNSSLHPAYHFDMTTRDMARFGVLCLNQGRWEGKQLIAADWLATSTQPLADAHDFGASAYGYMWWVVEGDLFGQAGLPDGSFSAQGTWSQLIMIAPDLDLVIVHRGKGRRGDRIAPEDLLEILTGILDAKS